MGNNIFKKSSMERINSPEQLNDYIRVTNPSVWVVLAAIILLLAGVFIWGFFGSLSSSLKLTGVARDGRIICYLSEEDAYKVKEDMEVKSGDIKGRIASISMAPLSYEEAGEKYADEYTRHALGLTNWNYEIIVDAKGVEDGLVRLDIITDRVSPISFILN
jgi:hypothetical protein